MPKPLLLLLMALATLPLFAGEIRFKNGDVLSGTVVQQANGKVLLATDNLGEIWVNEAQLLDVAPAPRGGSGTPNPEHRAALPEEDMPAPAARRQPGTPVWKTSLSLSAGHQSAVYPTTATPPTANLPGSRTEVAASLTIARVSTLDALSLTGALRYNDTQPWGPEFNQYATELTWHHQLNAESRTVSQTSYQVDRVRGIDFSTYQFGGVEFALLDDLQSKLTLAPGLVAMYDRKGNDFDHQIHVGVGLMLDYQYLINERLSFAHKAFLRQSVRNHNFWVVSASASVNAALSAHISWSTGVTYGYDATLDRQPSPARTTPRPNRDSLRVDSGLTLNY